MTDRLDTIQFETTTACNATCTMCPLPTMARARGRISEALALRARVAALEAAQQAQDGDA